MKKYLMFSLVFILFVLSMNDTFADRRYFGRTYLANTLPKGAFELELWNTGRIERQSGFYYRFQPRVEFEYGITDRLTTSLYFNFNQVESENNNFSSSSLGFSSTSIELRYRLTEIGQTFVDPALYFEFAYGGDELEYESKVILSRRFGDFITAININSEIEREIVDKEIESVFELTGGIMYEVSPNIALGLEFRNHRIFEDIYESEEAQATFLGPSINIQTKSFFIVFNFLTQINGSPESKNSLDLIHHEKYEFRTILGIEL